MAEYRKKTRWQLRMLVILMVFLSAPAVFAQQADSTRVFTKDNPLVYEDAWDLWPYAFLNEDGEPVGYNIDLLKLLCKELDIPYVIKLKPTSDALTDLKEGRADLMCGMDAHFHNDYAEYGKSVIQLFTHSVVHQKGEAPAVESLEDLASHRIIVHDGSFSHHLMIQRGWERNAIPYDDMQEAVQKAHLDPGSQVVWNTMSLKWLIHKLQYDNLEITPVDIQHGEYKFMSNNPRLLERLDSAFTILRSEDLLQPIQNKWFYPDKKDVAIPTWIWIVAGVLLTLTLGFIIYYAIYRLREKEMTKAIRQSNNRLALVLNTSKIRVWVYHVASRSVTPLDENGNPQPTHPSVDFFKQTTPHDFERLSDALKRIAKKEKERETLSILAKDNLSNKELRNFDVTLSVLRYDKNGRPEDIIGMRSDMTDERLKQQHVKDMMLRYQAIFNAAIIDTVAYDANGVMTDMNDKASQAFPEGKEAILAEKITIQDVLGMDIDVENMETIYVTQIFNTPDDERALNRKLLHGKETYYEIQFEPVRDENGKLLSIFGTGRNVTEIAKSYSHLQRNLQLLQDANNEMSNYIRNIDYVLQNGNVRMATYSPDNHMLAIYSEIGHVQYSLTQTRAIELTDEAFKKTAQRLLNSMDNRTDTAIETTIMTALHIHGGKQLFLQISLVPTYDKEKHVTGYFGMCRDVSEIKATEKQLELETAKAQEIETVKNAFLRNMSYEIRTPLNTVVGFAELFEAEHNAEDEAIFINEIKQSSSQLLKLINDILFLSRLDARMIEFKPKPTDIAAIFESRCQTGWFNLQKPGVTYSADSPYHHLVVEIDEQNLGIIIDQIVTNAAQHTTAGQVRTRYDYTGDNLVMAFQDTGCGIPEDQLEHIYDRFVSSGHQGTGLGLSICREIVQQMGGKITIKSEVGKGTIVWVAIPCKVIELERK